MSANKDRKMHINPSMVLWELEKRDLTQWKNLGDIGVEMITTGPKPLTEQGEGLKRVSLVNPKNGVSDRELPVGGVHARKGIASMPVCVQDVVDKYLSEGQITGFGLGGGWGLPITGITRHRKPQSRYSENQMRANLHSGRKG